jgi:hypothetical protein
MTVSKFIIFDHQPSCVNLDLVVVRHGGKPSRRRSPSHMLRHFWEKKSQHNALHGI